MMLQWVNLVSVHYLPVFQPSEEEKSNARLYADRVQQYMASASAMHASGQPGYTVVLDRAAS